MAHAVTDADSLLILRCKAEDATAFNEIVVRYQDRLYNYVCRMVGPVPDAEDLTQDVFVRAYVHIRSFESRATLHTWLFRIATNLCIDYLRRAERRLRAPAPPAAEGDDEGADQALDAPDIRYEPASVLLNRELAQRIDEAIQALPERHRAVVLLHDTQGMPYEDIARICGCPLGTVKSRLFNARAELRRRLVPYLADDIA